MPPNGVRTLLVVTAALLALVVGAADAAVAPPKCWMGKAGCEHTSTPHWNLRTYTGTVAVVGTRQQSLTCADVERGAREEIVEGHYSVKFALDRKASQTRVAADAQKQPLTSKPLALVFDVAATTHERVRTLAPNGDGTCTETFRDCDKNADSRAKDSLNVVVRGRQVIQETPGDFIKSRFLECAETPSSASLLPDDPLGEEFMTEASTLRAFRHRDTTVTHGRDRQIGDGSTSIEISGKLTYARTTRACTTYPLARTRCRTARG
jgi:hypothetical protein